MTVSKKNQIIALLKSIETGDPEPIAIVNEQKYIQHNPQTQQGSEGLAALFKRLSKTAPTVNIVRAFSDGEFVFAHTEYDFASRKIGFELFRFEDGLVVEHWDNIQQRLGPNQAGHSMVDGPTLATDHEMTEGNRAVVRSAVESVFIAGQLDRLPEFFDVDACVDHNPHRGDGVSALLAELEPTEQGHRHLDYQQIHRVLADGNFVLCTSEGHIGEDHFAFYDLFRLNAGKLVEHWDTREKIAPRSMWKNDNGKF